MKPRTVVLTMVLLLSLSSISMLSRGQNLSGMYGGNFSIALQGDVNLDPLTASVSDLASWKVMELVYDSLGRVNPFTLEVEPWAATDWEVNVAEGSLTANLRTDLRWSDGSVLDADDVVKTYQLYATPGLSVAKLSSSSVKFTFTSGGGTFLTSGLTKPIAWNEAGTLGYSGPFYVDFHNSTLLVIKANNNHFERPYLDSITYTYPLDIDRAAVSLIKGEVDMIGWAMDVNDPYNARTVDGRNTSLINESATIAIVHNPGLTYLYFGLDFSAGKPLSDQNLRVAIAKLLNKGVYVNVEGATTTPLHSVVVKPNIPWYNPDVPKYDAGYAFFEGKQDTNLMPGMMALDQAGYLDIDGDGWRETPSGSDFSLKLLAPTFTDDPRKATIGDAYVTVLKRAGVNASLVNTGGRDIYLERYTTRQDPSFIEEIPELISFNDGSINNALGEAADALDLSSRKEFINTAQQLIGEKAPFFPILSYETLEAYNKVDFTGWVASLGGVNNFWSFTNLHAISMGPLTADITTFAKNLPSSGSTDVIVTVTDRDGAPVTDASVSLVATEGVFADPSPSGDPNGRYSTTYTAPTVDAVTDVTISAAVTRLGYTGDVASIDVTVHPKVKTLIVEVNANPKVIARPGDYSTITVTVNDEETAAPIHGAKVELTLSLPGATLQDKSGTTVNGSFTTRLTGNASVQTFVKVTAKVYVTDYADVEDSTTVSVSPRYGSTTAITKVEQVPDIGVVSIIATITILALAVRSMRRRV